jgi:hypothetical protein
LVFNGPYACDRKFGVFVRFFVRLLLCTHAGYSGGERTNQVAGATTDVSWLAVRCRSVVAHDSRDLDVPDLISQTARLLSEALPGLFGLETLSPVACYVIDVASAWLLFEGEWVRAVPTAAERSCGRSLFGAAADEPALLLPNSLHLLVERRRRRQKGKRWL